MRVLLIEDDDRVSAALTPALQSHQLFVDRAATAVEGLARCGEADLILLDMGLPDMDGLGLCRLIRREHNVPIIAVTARRDEGAVVAALRAGVDDYVTKPFSTAVLMARIAAVMRRFGHESEAMVAADFGFNIDVGNRQVLVDKVPVGLTRKEFELLEVLVRANGDLVTRESLMQEVWDTSWVGASRTLDVHVATLRAKLGPQTAIETIRGVGYRLVPVEPVS